MWKTLLEILAHLRSANGNVGTKTRTATAIATATTTTLIAAPASPLAITIHRAFVSIENAHASQTGSITLEDGDGNVLAKVYVRAASAVSGMIDFGPQGFTLTAAKSLASVTSGGTPTAHITTYTTTA